MTRRSLLFGLIAAPLAPIGALAQTADARVADILTRAKERGVPGFEITETARYIGIGDAPREFRKEALDICEAVATSYREHFKARKFDLVDPRKKMIVVILKGPQSYEQFLNEKLKGAIGGQYNIKLNLQFMFDFRTRNDSNATRVNTMALVHETTHQLTFNTGILDRNAVVPLIVSEGLAAYAEVWRPKNRAKIGQINRERIEWLTGASGVSQKWIPLETLIAEDDPFREEDRQQAAYAEAWALMHLHMKNADRTPKLIAWIKAANTRKDESLRLADAREHLGDLGKLDRELKSYIRRPTVS